MENDEIRRMAGIIKITEVISGEGASGNRTLEVGILVGKKKISERRRLNVFKGRVLGAWLVCLG